MNTTDNKFLSENYTIIDQIGKGTFGEVYLTKDINDNKYASKVEDKTKSKRLIYEFKIYSRLQKKQVKCTPHAYELLETPKFNILVMDLLGNGLDMLFNKYKIFKIESVFALAIALINLIESLHNAGFIHRDIKPNNFMFGTNDNKLKLYIMDFGLSKQYLKHGKHISYKTDKSFIGTPRYTSINVHTGIEPSRRDDLESIGYMLIYFLRGSLPWQGLKKKKKDDNRTELVGNAKLCTNINKLCSDMPTCFKDFIIYCRDLKFDETPDYEYLKNLFIDCAKKNNIEPKYEWS
jgi:serine/threonine protein kinase